MAVVIPITRAIIKKIKKELDKGKNVQINLIWSGIESLDETVDILIDSEDFLENRFRIYDFENRTLREALTLLEDLYGSFKNDYNSYKINISVSRPLSAIELWTQ